MSAVDTTLSEEEVRARLAMLPDYLSGKEADPTGTVPEILHDLGVEALACVYDDAMIKSSGGTGSDGVSWPDISPKTKSYSRDYGEPHKKMGERPRGLLSDKQDARWRGLFAGAYRSFQRQGIDDKEAKGHAAAWAWQVLKSEGAKTRLQEYGQQTMAILQKSGDLFASFVPGDKNNLFTVSPAEGAVYVGSTLPYVGAHQDGAPSKNIPQRKLWPNEGEEMPDAWRQRLEPIIEEGVGRLLERLMR